MPKLQDICPRISKGKYWSTKRSEISTDLSWIMLHASEDPV